MKCLLIYICSHVQNDSSSQDFYSRTVAALDKKQALDQEVAQKLQDIKDAANAQEPVVPTTPQKPIVESTEDGGPMDAKVPVYAEERGSGIPTREIVDDDAKSVAGRKTMMKGGETKDLHSGKEAPMAVDREKEKYPAGKKPEKEEKVESKEDHEVEMELNSILKKGPSTFQPMPALLRQISI